MVDAAKEQSGCRALQRLLDVSEYLSNPSIFSGGQSSATNSIVAIASFVNPTYTTHPTAGSSTSRSQRFYERVATHLLKDFAMNELLASASGLDIADEKTRDDAARTADLMVHGFDRAAPHSSGDAYLLRYLRCPEQLMLDSRAILDESPFMPRSTRTPITFLSSGAPTPTGHHHHRPRRSNSATNMTAVAAALASANNPSSVKLTHAGKGLCAAFLVSTPEVREMLAEIPPNVIPSLMGDQYGNFLVQGMLETLPEVLRHDVICSLAPFLGPISTTSHGTFAVQKLLESLTDPVEVRLVADGLKDHLAMMMVDVNGGHVIQKLLGSSVFEEAGARMHIFDALLAHFHEITNDRHGCCIVQKALDTAMPEEILRCSHATEANLHHLITDPFGNYVVQYLVDLYANLVDVGMCHTLQLTGSWLHHEHNAVGSNRESTSCNPTPLSRNRSAAIKNCLDVAISPKGGDTSGCLPPVADDVSEENVEKICSQVRPFLDLLDTYDDEYFSCKPQRRAVLRSLTVETASVATHFGGGDDESDAGEDLFPDGSISSSGSEILETLNDELRTSNHRNHFNGNATDAGAMLSPNKSHVTVGGIKLGMGSDFIDELSPSSTCGLSTKKSQSPAGRQHKGRLSPEGGRLSPVSDPTTLQTLFAKKRATADLAVRPRVCVAAQVDAEIAFRDDTVPLYSRYDLLDTVPPRRYLPPARTRLDDSIDSLRFTRQRHHCSFTHIPTDADRSPLSSLSRASRCGCCVEYEGRRSTTGGLPMLVTHASRFILSLATYVGDHITVLCDNKFSSNVVEKLLLVAKAGRRSALCGGAAARGGSLCC